jgi:hypothetical protein
VPHLRIVYFLPKIQILFNLWKLWKQGFVCFKDYKKLDGLIPKGPEAILMPFLKFGQAIVKAMFIKNS